MDDTPGSSGFRCLFEVAAGQHGYVTAAQARSCGMGGSLLNYHTRTGRLIRVQRGLYRLRDYPTYWRDEVVGAWLAVGKDTAVVSHESALELLDLSDVIPRATHLTVPRSRRYLPNPPGVKIHTTTRPFGPLDLTWWEGVRITSATGTILDAREAGTQPDQIEMAIRQAMAAGLTTRGRLAQGARERNRHVQFWVLQALEQVGA